MHPPYSCNRSLSMHLSSYIYRRMSVKCEKKNKPLKCQAINSGGENRFFFLIEGVWHFMLNCLNLPKIFPYKLKQWEMIWQGGELACFYPEMFVLSCASFFFLILSSISISSMCHHPQSHSCCCLKTECRQCILLLFLDGTGTFYEPGQLPIRPYWATLIQMKNESKSPD